MDTLQVIWRKLKSGVSIAAVTGSVVGFVAANAVDYWKVKDAQGFQREQSQNDRAYEFLRDFTVNDKSVRGIDDGIRRLKTAKRRFSPGGERAIEQEISSLLTTRQLRVLQANARAKNDIFIKTNSRFIFGAGNKSELAKAKKDADEARLDLKEYLELIERGDDVFLP